MTVRLGCCSQARLTLRYVHRTSLKLASKHRNRRFILPTSRLHEFAFKNKVPGMHRMYTLSHAYGYDIRELTAWYGIPRR